MIDSIDDELTDAQFDPATQQYHFPNGLILPRIAYEGLFSYQYDGINWLWSLHTQNQCGGILSDEMGLGKTVQIASFIAGLFNTEQVSTIIIVVPVSVISHWIAELKKRCGRLRVKQFVSSLGKSKRLKTVKKVRNYGGIILTTYGMVTSSLDILTTLSFDYIILDEGHKIKNPSIQQSKSVASIKAKHRLILTGTPIQNNLKELWALFNFVSNGKLLGTKPQFIRKFESVILEGSDKRASEDAQERGARATEELRALVEPFILRREKKDVLLNSKSEGLLSDLSSVSKHDLIIWVDLAEAQLELYRKFIDSSEIRELLNSTGSPLAALTLLKKICVHAQLVEKSESLETLPVDILLKQSSKLQLLQSLLIHLKATGHRTAVFTQSKVMLGIIGRLLSANDISYLRIDGDVKQDERQKLLIRFNKDSSIDCFLLTTQTGGLGISLVGADRAVVFDPAWNPSVDNQVVDRVYRLGQQRDVVFYRLICAGTIEEKMYRKQVFKGGLFKSCVGVGEIKQIRYFSRDELKALFTLENTSISQTCEQLNKIHATGVANEDSHNFIRKCACVVGISDHNLLYGDNTDLATQLQEMDINDSIAYEEDKLNQSTFITDDEFDYSDLENDQEFKMDDQMEDFEVSEDAALIDAAPIEDASVIDAAPIEDAALIDAAPIEDASVIDAAPIEDASVIDAAPIEDASVIDAAPIEDASVIDAAPIEDASVIDAAPIEDASVIDAAPIEDASVIDAAPIEDASVIDAAPIEDASVIDAAPIEDASVIDAAPIEDASVIDAAPIEDASVIDAAPIEDASVIDAAPIEDASVIDAAPIEDASVIDAAPIEDASATVQNAQDQGYFEKATSWLWNILIGSKQQESICKNHIDILDRYKLKGTKCRCYIQKEAIQKYNSLLEDYAMYETLNDLKYALSSLVEALEICDDDPRVHAQAIRLSKKLNLI